MLDLKIFGSLWLIGCGNMAGAMLSRWLECGMDRTQITVIRPSGVPVADGVRVLTEPPIGDPPAFVLLGFKPQKLDQIAPRLAPFLGKETTLISLLAGVNGESLGQHFPEPGNILRAMPNTPALLGKGATSLCQVRYYFMSSRHAPPEWVAEKLMEPLGLVEWIEDEELFDTVAALSASGPAFLFRFIDALSEGAAELGLPPDQARRLAVATVEGAGALAAASTETPHQLAERVASPGGMTREGLDILDQDHALRSLVHRTLEAAVRRSREMGEEARRG